MLLDIDPDIVGFKEDQDHVVKKLLDETTKRRCVVSIWGAGGLGKTTLAQKVYNWYVCYIFVFSFFFKEPLVLNFIYI